MNYIKELSKFSTATIHEALGKIGNLPSAIKPIGVKMKVCGPAYTVKTMPRDNILLHRAYAYAKPGNVITKGINGLVIDGFVRDADDIEAMGFNVFSRGLCVRGTSNFGEGFLNEPIVIGDVMINPCDIIVGDRDGVVVVPKDRIEEAIEKSKAREEKEENVRKQLREGKTSIEIYGWDKQFGY
jgi:4-hydroxy-4-methyl-2-oxoglutarate aldolase